MGKARVDGPSAIDGLASMLYEAVLDAPRWAEALGALMELAHARGVSLSRADLSVPTNSVIDVVGQSAEAVREYHAHYVALDPLIRLGAALPAGRWTSDWAVLGPAYAQTAYYNDFMRRHDNHAVLVAPLWSDGAHTALVALQRSASQGEFAAEPDPALVHLLPHLQRAVKLHFNTQELQAQADFAAATLHRVATPVIVVEADGHVVLANGAGEHLCRSSRLLTISGQRLVAKFQDAALQAALQEACAPGRARPAWLRLAPAAQEEPLLVVVTPMAASAPLARPWQRPLAVVMASRGAAGARNVEAILRELFSLTAAEARVAAAIAEGRSPAEIAGRHGIAVLTVRGQLKSVYSKMGVRRQAELSRMLTKLQAMLPRQAQAE
ncbi:MAG TPA: helix-turn-helix transcriptional regulator [Ramlibacter sp.]|uniref:helix-turn-helix transcriptional regulator n=1 Tax=Ramlibacter sp. TaxID=1917967 RepID=UPI002C439000|nr:helix-turn-helix transcriptional regulator [Ramlibacter sp.]HVZ43369.1 helix-turn-helix transcriptional regulator [Ramlibacter sp.]